MRQLICVWAALWAFAGQAALAQPAPAPQPQPAKPTISLTRMGATLRAGDSYGEQQAGRSCDRIRNLRWGGDGRLDDIAFQKAFKQVMVGAGFLTAGARVERDLFSDSRPESADIEVGALITNLRVRVCTERDSRNLDSHGSATMDVEWQIYSPEERRVIAKIRTSASAGGDRPIEELLEPILTKAFIRNVEDLASNPQFTRLMRGALVSPPAAPLAPMKVALALPRVVPLSQAAASVVSIVLEDGHGSGVVVSADGYILTNYHVAGPSGTVRVRWADGSETTGEVVRTERKRDVALVRVAAAKGPPLPVRRTPVVVGETVYALGSPLDTKLAGTLTRGIVSANRIESGVPMIQSDVAITHGNSGGPLLDEKGAVVGLSEAVIEPDGSPIGLNFFIPIGDALRALAVEAPRPAPANQPVRARGKPSARR